MICTNCKNRVPTDSEYCPFCGEHNSFEQESANNSRDISNIEMAFSYLELKEWNKAKELFDSAIINNDNKAKGYIGRLLVELKLTNIEDLVPSKKLLNEYYDFNMAIKYADECFLQKLESIALLNKNNICEKRKKEKKIALIFGCVILAVGVFLILTYFAIIPAVRYTSYKNDIENGRVEKAIKSYSKSTWFEYDDKTLKMFYDYANDFYKKGELAQAKLIFENIKNYRDSGDKIIDVDNALKLLKIKNAGIGDIIKYGAYEQDNNTKNGPENIEWIVLEKAEDKVLVISKYCLDCVPYMLNEVDEATWEQSYLRSWMNNNFYNEAFDSFEKSNILKSTVKNYDYTHVESGTIIFADDKMPAGKVLKSVKLNREHTRDYLFVLNDEEAELYFTTSKARKAKPTFYAIEEGADIGYGDGKHSGWWLRCDPDMNNNHSLVSGKGGISTNSIAVNNKYQTVRPVMWISLEEN